jgi:hypothetical protein
VRRRAEPQRLALHEELDALARHYLQLHNELERAQPESALRRRLEDRVLDVRERFDRLLDEWVQDPALRDEWREYLHTHVPEPSEPPSIRPLVFRGGSEVSGSVVEIRRENDDFEVWVDGTLVERIGAEKDFAVGTPGVRFRLDGNEFEETFNASPEALRALIDYLGEEDTPPPWEYAAELLADGLIDVHFDLTPRGKRALAGAGSPTR